METENVSIDQSDISIRQVVQKDFEQIADLYYRYLLGDFVGYCGRRVFVNYLNSLCNSRQGALWCAVNEEKRIIGFAAGIIDHQRFNRNWLRRNLFLLVFSIMIKIVFSHNFRGFIYKRVRERLRGNSTIRQTDGSQTEQIRAYSKWAVVDEAYRRAGDNVASRLLASIEKDIKEKGASQIYSFVHRTNTSSIFMHLKNGWKVVDKNEKSFQLAKELNK